MKMTRGSWRDGQAGAAGSRQSPGLFETLIKGLQNLWQGSHETLKNLHNQIQSICLTLRLAWGRRYKAGQTEKVILRKLGATDPDDKRHVIRLLRNFEYRGHLCMVFEPMVRPRPTL